MQRRLGPRICPRRAKDCCTGEKGRARPGDAVISMHLSAVKRIAAFVDGIVSKLRQEPTTRRSIWSLEQDAIIARAVTD